MKRHKKLNIVELKCEVIRFDKTQSDYREGDVSFPSLYSIFATRWTGVRFTFRRVPHPNGNGRWTITNRMVR